MNHLTKEQLNRYKAIYKRVFGKEISDAEALEQAMRFLKVMQVIYKPIPADQEYGANKAGS